jgi:hypothetical protein
MFPSVHFISNPVFQTNASQQLNVGNRIWCQGYKTSFCHHWCYSKKSFYLYYNNIKIVNDTAGVISEWHHNLDLWLLITLLELSIMLLENLYSRGVAYDDCDKMIKIMITVQATGVYVPRIFKTFLMKAKCLPLKFSSWISFCYTL